MRPKSSTEEKIALSVKAFGYCDAPHHLTMSSLSAGCEHLHYVISKLHFDAPALDKLFDELRKAITEAGGFD